MLVAPRREVQGFGPAPRKGDLDSPPGPADQFGRSAPRTQIFLEIFRRASQANKCKASENIASPLKLLVVVSRLELWRDIPSILQDILQVR